MNGKPTRMFMDDPSIQWRNGKPDYSKADEVYLQGRTKHHEVGSLEEIVSNIIKTFEMEAQHKVRAEDFGIVTSDFKMNTNGGRYFTIPNLIERGTYNLFLDDSPLYDASKETRESSDNDFKTTFPDGFSWEVLEVIHGPPKLVFTWRHWATMTGPFKGNEPTGQLLEMYGCVTADVSPDNKLQCVHFYVDANPFISKLRNDRCPLMH
ncbi:uncharacterized protein [Amphiura filiformis]|uniref:uncharacterized protein n=1 Tax=Amphiura filiformis TaxID=82378 RepID=UPI003B20DC06